MDMGVKQGCLLSPLLFTLMLNDLHDFLGGVVKVCELKIRVLMYADDVIIFGEDEYVLQGMINRLFNYCKVWNLTVNLQKSKIMIFNRSGRNSSSYI